MKRLKNYNFWISLVSAILLIVQNVFNIKLDVAYINEITSTVLGILVVVGIINDPTKIKHCDESKSDTNDTNTDKNDSDSSLPDQNETRDVTGDTTDTENK